MSSATSAARSLSSTSSQRREHVGGRPRPGARCENNTPPPAACSAERDTSSRCSPRKADAAASSAQRACAGPYRRPRARPGANDRARSRGRAPGRRRRPARDDLELQVQLRVGAAELRPGVVDQLGRGLPVARVDEDLPQCPRGPRAVARRVQERERLAQMYRRGRIAPADIDLAEPQEKRGPRRLGGVLSRSPGAPGSRPLRARRARSRHPQLEEAC